MSVSGESLSLHANEEVGQDLKAQDKLMAFALLYGRQQCNFASTFAHMVLDVIAYTIF